MRLWYAIWITWNFNKKTNGLLSIKPTKPEISLFVVLLPMVASFLVGQIACQFREWVSTPRRSFQEITVHVSFYTHPFYYIAVVPQLPIQAIGTFAVKFAHQILAFRIGIGVECSTCFANTHPLIQVYAVKVEGGAGIKDLQVHKLSILRIRSCIFEFFDQFLVNWPWFINV